MSALTASAQTPFTFGISDFQSAAMVFTGGVGNNDTLQFTPEGAGSVDFTISNSDGGILDGLLGRIGGTFYLGTVGPGGFAAPMSGSGIFGIAAPGAGVFAAEIEFLSIVQVGAIGGLNYESEVNLTNFTYQPVANPVATPAGQLLQSLADDPESFGNLAVTFQFSAPKTLANLKATGASHTSLSYSGTATFDTTADTPIPEPSTYAALAGVAVLGAVLRRRIRRA